MMLGGAALGSVSLGSVLQDPGAIADPMAEHPITLDLNGVVTRCEPNSLQIEDTLGQPMTARFSLIESPVPPVEGDQVRVRYYEQVLFVGTIDRIHRTVAGLTTRRYDCECKDVSQVLERRRLRRNFTNLPVHTILDSILDNELAGEPLSIGTIDSRASVPLVDSKKASVFEVCRTLAAATGQTFYVDHDGSIQMRSTTVASAPLVLSESVVERDGASVKSDREAYRNHQIVVVTGTPPNQEADALVVTVERSNADQIAERQSIEGGTGRYDSIEEITHPTSNDGVGLALLGISFANLRLSTSGALRTTIACQVRGYGFRAGQVATADLPTLGVSGTVVIQRVSIREQFGRSLVHQVELVLASAQQRAYEAWLSIVQGGKVTVQMPSAVTNNLEIFNTPGSHTWTVPAGVTVIEITCHGSGGGGGGARPDKHANDICYGNSLYTGGDGGPGGKAITALAVVPGQEINITVGSGGLGGANGNVFAACGGGQPQIGSPGGLTRAYSGTTTYCQADSGLGGGVWNFPNPGPDGAPGGGVGDAVSIGGGKAGGAGAISKGDPWNPTSAQAGHDGEVVIGW